MHTIASSAQPVSSTTQGWSSTVTLRLVAFIHAAISVLSLTPSPKLDPEMVIWPPTVGRWFGSTLVTLGGSYENTFSLEFP